MTSSKTTFTRLGRAGLAIVAAAACALAASCGGGGSSSGSNLSNTSTSTIAQQVASCNASQPQSQVAMPSTGNSVPVMMDSGPCDYGVPFGSPSGTAASVYIVGAANVPYTTITICSPGSTTACQTIDHILVDTGSSGLRLMSSVLTGAATLPAISIGGAPLLECVQFADGYSWGSIRSADVHIAGERASGIPVQVIGDSNSYTVPNACMYASTTPLSPLNDVGSFGANGVLGIGLFAQDCGSGCVLGSSNFMNTYYYVCPTTSTCSNANGAALNQQATNPVAAFAADNNGVVLDFSAANVAPASGALNVQGTLIFGINTQTNNQATASTLNTYLADGYGDFFSTITSISDTSYAIATTAYGNSFIDSGSNGIYIPGTTIPTDPTLGWFVPSIAAGSLPADVISLGATQQGSQGNGYVGGVMTSAPTGPTNTFTFEIANANTVLFNSGSGNNTVFNGLGTGVPSPSASGPSETGGIDWGLPFFLGKTIYVGLEGKSINIAGAQPQPVGPFWAY